MRDFQVYLDRLAQKSIKLLSWTLAPSLVLLGYVSYKTDPVAGLAYLPCALVLFCGAFLGRSSPKATMLADLSAFLGLAGAHFIVFQAKTLEFTLTTAPLQTALLVALSLNFRTFREGLIRNLLFAAGSAAFLIATQLAVEVSIQAQWLVGLALGNTGYVLYYKWLRSHYLYQSQIAERSLRERKAHQRLFSEATKHLYPHQVELILEGARLEQSMPTDPSVAWLAHARFVGAGLAGGLDEAKLEKHLSELSLRAYRYRLCGGKLAHLSSESFLEYRNQSSFRLGFGYPFKLSPDDDSAISVVLKVLEYQNYFRKIFEDCSLVVSLSHGLCQGVFEAGRYRLIGEGVRQLDRQALQSEAEQLGRLQLRVYNDQGLIFFSKKVVEQLVSSLPGKAKLDLAYLEDKGLYYLLIDYKNLDETIALWQSWKQSSHVSRHIKDLAQSLAS